LGTIVNAWPNVALPLVLAAAGCAGGAEPPPASALQDGPSAARFVSYAEDGRTVSSVTPDRYLGLWYEIATTGSFQQGTCVGTTATYSPIDADTVEVYNRCLRGDLDGPVSEITGTATATDPSFTRLLVDFGFGFEAPYDIVELDGAAGDAPYAFAGVSSFEGAQLWILARSPQLDAEIFEALVERFEDRGYADPRGRLKTTPHAPEEAE
jgi:apolipoprotein D and lipocalin family protein